MSTFLNTYCNITKGSVLVWWTAWYLPKVIFAIQMIVIDSNWRYCCKKNAQRIPFLNSEVNHKLYFFPLTLNFGMVTISSVKTLKRPLWNLHPLFNLKEANVGWLGFSVYLFLHHISASSFPQPSRLLDLVITLALSRQRLKIIF